MADPTTDHPRDELLTAFRLGRLDEFLAATVARHLENCPQCRGRVGDTPSLASKTPSASATGPYLLPELGAHPHYQVIRELARGGMGVVYLVRNTLMDRFEVLKVLNKTLLARPGAAERFLREIRSAARLHHPNVVTAYAALPLGDAIAFAMEFVDGDDLSQMVKARGPLPVGHACAYTAQAALGLQHAHERDMVHRDIKPSNLILARMADGEVVKVLDFGLAKASSEGGDVSLTGTDDLMGTPDYIAPEQIQYAKQVDIRADIYSLGCTLYYLLAARPPFTEGTSYQRMTAHLTHRPDPVTKFRPDVPIGVVAILDKMMAKLPDERYSTPREVVAALGPFANVATEVRSPTLIEKLPTNQTDDIPNVRPHSAERTPTRIETGRTPTIIETPPDLEPATAHPGRLRRFWLFAKSLRGIFLLLCTVCFLLVEFSGFLNLLRNQGLFESTPEAKSFRSKRWEVVDVNRVEPSAFISSGWGGGYAWKQGSVWTFANHLKAGEVDEDGNYSSKLFSNNDAFEWHVVDGNLELKDYGDKTYSLQILERNDAAVTLAVRNNGVLTPEFVKLRATSQFNRWYRIFDHLIFHIYWLPAALGVLGAFS